jgi:hypothetical protein
MDGNRPSAACGAFGQQVGPADHAGDEDRVDGMPHEEQAAGEQPEEAAHPPARVEAVNAREAEASQAPEQIRHYDQFHGVLPSLSEPASSRRTLNPTR